MSVDGQQGDPSQSQHTDVEPVSVDNYAGRPGPRDTERRFEVSRENFSRLRLKALREGFDEMKADFPEVLGLTLFGSMVNGYAVQESDIDCNLIVNADLASAVDPDLVVASFEHPTKSNHTVPTTEFDEQSTENFRTELRNRVLARATDLEVALDATQLEHIFVFPISREIIDKYITDAKSHIHAVRDWRRKSSIRQAEIRSGIDESHAISAPPKPVTIEISPNLIALFYIQMGHGLNELREYLIDRLAADRDGEMVWNGIIYTVEGMEQRGAIETNKMYPRTLEEAREVYCRDTNTTG